MKNTDMKKRFEKDPVHFIICSFLFAVAAVYYILLLLGATVFKNEGIFFKSINVFGGFVEYNNYLRVLSYVVVFLSISKLIRAGINLISQGFRKHKSVLNLISSFTKYIALIVLVFVSLRTFGVDTTTLLASAGILSLIVGLGAQPLIEDIIAGLFIVFEGVFEDGDIVVVDGFRGSVEEIGIRSTRIMDAGGNVKVINNSDIRSLINMTNELSVAICYVDIEYSESLAHVENVIEANLGSIKAAIPDIHEGPFYNGVATLGASGVTLRFTAQCKEDKKYQVERDLNRHIKLMFDENNINIPFMQVVVHSAETAVVHQKGNAERAAEFVSEQKLASNGIEESQNV